AKRHPLPRLPIRLPSPATVSEGAVHHSGELADRSRSLCWGGKPLRPPRPGRLPRAYARIPDVPRPIGRSGGAHRSVAVRSRVEAETRRSARATAGRGRGGRSLAAGGALSLSSSWPTRGRLAHRRLTRLGARFGLLVCAPKGIESLRGAT